jgi:hypothetical protein
MDVQSYGAPDKALQRTQKSFGCLSLAICPRRCVSLVISHDKTHTDRVSGGAYIPHDDVDQPAAPQLMQGNLF